MTQLIIKSENRLSAESLIRSAIKAQLGIIATGIKITRERMQHFENKYEFSTQELLKKESNGTIDDGNLEIIAWLGEYRMLERLGSEYNELEGIEICS